MTDRPTEVTVQVAYLEGLRDGSAFARDNLIAAIPGPEWEPTDEMVEGTDRALLSCNNGMNTTALLKAMHREGLL